MMLVVKQGIVNHNGAMYGKGQALPDDISREEAHRLIETGACVEGVAAMIAAAEEAAKPIPLPIVDGIARPLAAVNMGEPVDLNFDPDSAIRGVGRK